MARRADGSKWQLDENVVRNQWDAFCATPEGAEAMKANPQGQHAHFNRWLRKHGQLEVFTLLWRKVVFGETSFR